METHRQANRPASPHPRPDGVSGKDNCPDAWAASKGGRGPADWERFASHDRGAPMRSRAPAFRGVSAKHAQMRAASWKP